MLSATVLVPFCVCTWDCFSKCCTDGLLAWLLLASKAMFSDITRGRENLHTVTRSYKYDVY